MNLEKTEDSVKIAIASGDLKKALKMTSRMTYPTHDDMPTFMTQDVYGKKCSGSSYDAFWMEKRAAYRAEIDKLLKSNYPLLKNSSNSKRSSASTEIHENNTTNETISSDLTGEWNGTFGENKITLVIKSININRVTGHDIVQGKTRHLSGKVDENNNFILNEPGDEEWDGVFKFNIENSHLIGNWKANNGKMNIDFVLDKK